MVHCILLAWTCIVLVRFTHVYELITLLEYSKVENNVAQCILLGWTHVVLALAPMCVKKLYFFGLDYDCMVADRCKLLYCGRFNSEIYKTYYPLVTPIYTY